MGYNSVADIIPVSATVFEIFTVKDRKLPISATPTTLRPNFSVQGQTLPIMPKKYQNAKPKISRPRVIKKCQI